MALRKEEIEEILELCWVSAENNQEWLERQQLPEQLLCYMPQPMKSDMGMAQEAIDHAIQQGLIEQKGDRVRLSPTGSKQAHQIVRRHRLTEVLLHNILDVSAESMETTACQVEHVLNDEVTDAVCTFLGHPPTCPHGCPIPKGKCCQSARSTLKPLIVPVMQLAVGEKGTVAFVHTKRHNYLQRLGALGLVPGASLCLRQTAPTLVMQLGETELALDRQAGEEIFVRRRPS